MQKLKHTEIETLKDIFSYPQGAGYVLTFSDRTIGLFFEEEFGIDLDAGKYKIHGSSKFKRLHGLLEVETGAVGAKVLRVLWEHRAGIIGNRVDDPQLSKKYFSIIQRLEGGSEIINTDALEKFVESETLDELIAAIQRDIDAKKPQSGLDRLHTYCMKKFAHLLKLKGVEVADDTPLHGRAGMYVKALEAKNLLHGMSLKIMKSSLSVFDEFNHVRNNKTFAHDNEILDAAEARYIFDSVCNMLRFIRAIEAVKFGEA